MAPVGVSGVGVTPDDVGRVGEGLECLLEPFLEDGIGGWRILLVSSVD